MDRIDVELLDTAGLSATELFRRASRRFEGVSFLHTCPGSPAERWSILAWSPADTFTWSAGDGRVGELGAHLKERLRRPGSPSRPGLPFTGGAIGVLAYDLGLELKGIVSRHPDASGIPMLCLHFYENALVMDLSEARAYAVCRQPSFLKECEALVEEPPCGALAPGLVGAPRPGMDTGRYGRAFDAIRDYILDGQIYQVNLTYPIVMESAIHPPDFFVRLVELNPAPFAAYVSGEGFQVLSLSPERFLRLQGRHVIASPVKGTRPRFDDPARDRAMVEELLHDEKERAELNMITDLLRNDVGITAEFGSVRVARSQAVQQCPSVWHTYSEIHAALREPFTAVDLLLSSFPGGSVTGCPKKRAMELIDELETARRGIYTGAVGYFDYGGDMDFNIAIRTFVNRGAQLVYQVGGGIVMDSRLDREYAESLSKAHILLSLAGGP